MKLGLGQRKLGCPHNQNWWHDHYQANILRDSLRFREKRRVVSVQHFFLQEKHIHWYNSDYIEDRKEIVEPEDRHQYGWAQH